MSSSRRRPRLAHPDRLPEGISKLSQPARYECTVCPHRQNHERSFDLQRALSHSRCGLHQRWIKYHRKSVAPRPFTHPPAQVDSRRIDAAVSFSPDENDGLTFDAVNEQRVDLPGPPPFLPPSISSSRTELRSTFFSRLDQLSAATGLGASTVDELCKCKSPDYKDAKIAPTDLVLDSQPRILLAIETEGTRC